jgi:hypothetical protein
VRATVLTSENAFEIAIPEGTPYGASFNTIGPNAEWRLERGATMPHALILRHVFETDPETEGSRRQHYLAVVKIVGPSMCLAGWVEASENAAHANTVARRIADDSRHDHCAETVTITKR